MRSITPRKIKHILRPTLLREGVLVDSLELLIPESLFYWRKGFHEIAWDQELNHKHAEFRIHRRGFRTEIPLFLKFRSENGIYQIPRKEGEIEIQIPTREGAKVVLFLIHHLAPFQIHVSTLPIDQDIINIHKSVNDPNFQP